MSKYSITEYTDTAIKDKDTIDFINNIISIKLQRIVRERFEERCWFDSSYNLKVFREEFKVYLKQDSTSYFLPGLDERTENILKKLLKV